MMFKSVPLFILIACVSSETWYARLPPKPKELAHKKGCYVKEINDVIPFGEETTPNGSCIRIDCGRRYIYYASCIPTSAEPPCYVTDVKPGAPYPDCCPSLKCDEDNIIS